MEDLSGRDLVVVAASAGGVEALRTLLGEIPAGLRAAVLVVLHISPRSGSALAGILDRAGPLKAASAEHGEILEHGRVYVAPPDHHLLVGGEQVALSRGPRHHGHRPAADPLFLSAALAGGPRTLGVVLSGTLDDGARGCATVERLGGAVAVQDPDHSAFDGMPRAALAVTRRPYVGSVKAIARWIARESVTPVEAEAATADAETEREVSLFLSATQPDPGPDGRLSVFTCPDCNGPLFEADDRGRPRYACLVGHAWSIESMVDGQSEAVERAFWVAILRLEERIRIMDRMVVSTEGKGQLNSARRLRERARQDKDALRTLRELQMKIKSVDGGLSSGHDEASRGHGHRG
ncbi:chemotaxis protein CheB [Sphaerisporangium dianthi]|uniref:protein-glutamate methylesterase n=1 Tax=Sphaerisporangium dianthi TaxID=1436120 RepID=A0ABV9CW56_9ACTN